MQNNDDNQFKRKQAENGLQYANQEEKRKRTEKLLRRYTRELIILDGAIKDISKSDNYDTLIKTSVNTVRKAGNLESIALYLIDEVTGNPVISPHLEVAGGLREAREDKELTDKIIAKAIETGRTITASDVSCNPPKVDNFVKTIETEDTGTLVGIPLKSRGRTIGIVVGMSQYKREFLKVSIPLLETIGCQVGVSIHHAQLLEKLGKLSLIDDLTGLYNRRYLEEALEAEIYRSLRCGNSFSLIKIDLDKFETYVEKFGRQSGNYALKSLAHTFKSELRKIDVACRSGDDEFSIVLPATDAQKAQKVVDRIRTVFLEMFSVKSCYLESPPGFNAGISQFPQAAVTAQDMIHLADSALDCAKENNSVLVSDLTIGPVSQTHREAQQVYSLVKFVERREFFTIGHAKNVSKISGLLGKAIGLPASEIERLQTAAFLHDIGKSRVPASLLTKPDKLTREELEIMRNHSLEGARLVARANELKELVPFVKHHHEKFDGTGYPNGLKGDNIPLLSRIICIADAFDTMIRHRAYSVAKTSKDALDEICKCSGTQFDPQLVSALVTISDSLN